MVRAAPIAALLVASLAHTARAEVIPLGKVPLHAERDGGTSCDFSFVQSSVDQHVFARGHRLYLQPWDLHPPTPSDEPVPLEDCRIPLAVVHDGDVAVYAMRISGKLIVAARADGASVIEGWLPLATDHSDEESVRDVGVPIQLVGTLGGREYVITASISQTWRDKEPLLALAIRRRPATAAK